MGKKTMQQQVPWYESNLLWGPVSLGAGILLAVVAAKKHDLRWLLYIASPCFVFATWSLLKWWLRKWWLVAALVVCTLLICGSFYGLGVWLGKPDQGESGGKAAKPGKAAIYFGEGPGTGYALPMNIFESGVALDGYAGEHKIATLQMKPNGQVKLDVVVNDDTGNPMIEIHDDEFSVSRTDLDRNSSKDEYEVINSDGLVIFQLIRRSPSEVVINGVFKIAGGKSYLLAGPKGALETNVVRYDYVPKPLFKYPSWRFPGQYVTQP